MKRYLLDRPKTQLSSPLAGSDVHRDCANVHLQFQVKMQLSALEWSGNKHDLAQSGGLGFTSQHSLFLAGGVSQGH